MLNAGCLVKVEWILFCRKRLFDRINRILEMNFLRFPEETAKSIRLSAFFESGIQQSDIDTSNEPGHKELRSERKKVKG